MLNWLFRSNQVDYPSQTPEEMEQEAFQDYMDGVLSWEEFLDEIEIIEEMKND